MQFSCYKLRKRDLVKIGRVRFKVRDIMSHVYRSKNESDELCSQQFRQMH